MPSRHLLALGIAALLLLSGLRAERPAPTPALGSSLYLPLVAAPDRFGALPAIWSHSDPPASHEVALFRYRFTLPQGAAPATLHLFADTRYDLWLDGVWQGRGPARFSSTLHEYDRYSFPALAAGEHVLAVRVQWSPNQRRALSTRPQLRARLLVSGTTLGESGPAWRVLAPDAWRRDSAPVHQFGLIGATELLDLRALPASWADLTFDDRSWGAAVAVTTPDSRWMARTIPPLAEVPIPLAQHERGTLSPGMQLIEVAGPTTLPLVGSVPVTLRTLAQSIGGDAAWRLDGQPLEWASEPGGHPDLRRATRALAPGAHSLEILPPAGGATLAITSSALAQPLPLVQRNHAGRRSLLATLAPTAGATPPSSAPLTVALDGPSYLILDLGRTVHGRLVGSIEGPPGTVVDVGWDERLWQGRPLPFPGTFHAPWNQVDSWVTDGAARPLTTMDARAGRYLLIAAWGPGRVTLSNLRVLEERLPVTLHGTFSSGDPQLDQIWQIGVTSLYPNMTDGYTDTPWRERGQWWGDAFTAYRVNQVAFGDQALFRRGLLLMDDAFEPSGRPPATAPRHDNTLLLDYGMLWVQGLRLSNDQQPDPTFVEERLPTVRAFLGYLAGYENPTTGLLDLPNGHWSQGALVDWLGASSRYGQSAALNAMYVGTLRDAAALAEAAGSPEESSAWDARAEALRAAINALLYQPATGRYAATLYQGQLLAPSPHAQAWPLAYAIPPASEEGRVADALVEEMVARPLSQRVELYGYYWVLEGLGRAGRIAPALDLIRQEYGALMDQGVTIWPESITAPARYDSSLSHGWGGAPTYFMSRYLLGATATAAGWSVQPPLGAWPGASGALPLAPGVLRVTWEGDRCGAGYVSIESPADAGGTLLLPLPAADPTLRLWQGETLLWGNGGATPASAATAEGEGLRLPLAGGSHELTYRRDCP